LRNGGDACPPACVRREAFPFEAIVFDGAFYACRLVAEKLGVPAYPVWAGPTPAPVSRTAPPPFFGLKPMRGPLGRLRDAIVMKMVAHVAEKIAAHAGRVVVVAQGTIDNRDPEKLFVPVLSALAASRYLVVSSAACSATGRPRIGIRARRARKVARDARWPRNARIERVAAWPLRIIATPQRARRPNPWPTAPRTRSR
jgi:hypothetical protein